MHFQQCCEHTTHSISVILKLVSLLFSTTYFLLRLPRRSSVLIRRAPCIPPARTLVSLISPVCALVEPMACVYFSSRMARSVAWRQRHKAWPAAAAGIVPRRASGISGTSAGMRSKHTISALQDCAHKQSLKFTTRWKEQHGTCVCRWLKHTFSIRVFQHFHMEFPLTWVHNLLKFHLYTFCSEVTFWSFHSSVFKKVKEKHST